MSDLQNQLRGLGLSNTEASIYICGVSHGELGVAELQKLTSIKRPTIYHALYGLLEKGLVAKSGSEARMRFTFTGPEHLAHLAETQILDIKKKSATAQELLAQVAHVASPGETVVSHYEGIEGVKTVVDEALYCRSRQWDIIAPKQNFFAEFSTEYADYFMSTRNKMKIKARSLWEEKLGKSKLSIEEIAVRQPRYLPDVMKGEFKSVIIVFDERVAIISSVDSLSAILITSTEIAALFRAMFNGLWVNSLPIPTD